MSLPSRIALLLGIGAVSIGGTEAATPARDPGVAPQSEALGPGELCLWAVGEQVFLAERDGPARQLALTDTAQARRLRALLQRYGAVDPRTGVRLDPMLLAGGGGQGFDWTAHRPIGKPAQSSATPAADQSNPQPKGPPQGSVGWRSGSTRDTSNASSAGGR